MPENKIENAINGVADAVNDSSSNSQGSLGIKGMLWNNVGNMAAMAIIAASFLYLGQDFMAHAKEDRTMFRDELKAIRKSQEDRWEKTDTTHAKAMEKMGTTVERATTSLETAVSEMKHLTRVMGTNQKPPQ